ncbi:MAG: transposase, partial [Cyclobacteriaceae bacterium]
MSRKYKFRNQDKLYFVSFATVHWIDLFVRPVYSEIILDSLRHCQKSKGLEINAWCITSHVHLIIGTSNKPMQDILRDFKSYASQELKEEIN